MKQTQKIRQGVNPLRLQSEVHILLDEGYQLQQFLGPEQGSAVRYYHIGIWRFEVGPVD